MKKGTPSPADLEAGQLPYRKRDMDDEGSEGEFLLKVGTGEEFLITEGMIRAYPYLKDPEARLTVNFSDIYLILCGYSLQHISEDLFKDKARLSIFRTNVLDFGIQLSTDEILMIQKDELDELKTISDYVRDKGSKKYAKFRDSNKTIEFMTEMRDSFASLFEKISPDHILDLLQVGKIKELVLKNWSTKQENSVILFTKQFVTKFFR